MSVEVFCKRCALDELAQDYDATLEEYLKSLDDEVKVAQCEYESRIGHCVSCDHMVGGTCTLCGCFVKARAAKKRLGCPSIPPKWVSAE